MGKVLVYGTILAIPAVIVAGPLLGKLHKNTTTVMQDRALTARVEEVKALPSIATSLLFALLPVCLIALAVVADHFCRREVKYKPPYCLPVIQ